MITSWADISAQGKPIPCSVSNGYCGVNPTDNFILTTKSPNIFAISLHYYMMFVLSQQFNDVFIFFTESCGVC